MTTLDIDIQCKKKSSDKIFWQVFTIRTKPLDLTAKVSIFNHFSSFIHSLDNNCRLNHESVHFIIELLD